MATQITIPSSVGVPITGQRSYTPKQLQFAFTLAGAGSALQPFAFASTGSSLLTVSNARSSARIAFAGAIKGATADIAIWGLSQDQMNQMQTLGLEYNKVARNLLSVNAGDSVSGLSRVFTGNILQAWGDYNNAPDVAMRFACTAAYFEGASPFASTSFTGKVPVVQVFSTIAQQAGWGFLNNGVDSSIAISNPYYYGSAPDQYKKLAQDVRVNAHLYPGSVSSSAQNYTLIIWPEGGGTPQGGSGIPIISPQTGMIGYPTFQQNGLIMVRTLFNPQIRMGNQIQVQSSLFTNQSLAALLSPNSIWTVSRLDHQLDSLVPKGEWSSTIYATTIAPFKPTLPPAP